MDSSPDSSHSSTRKPVQGIFCAIGCELIFGFSFIFTKTAVAKYHISDLLAWRFFLAFALLTLAHALGIIKLRISRRALPKLICLGVLFPGGYYLFEAFGIARTTVSETSLIIATVPVVTALLSMFFLHDTPGKRMTLGIALAICGMVTCVASKGLTASLDIPGYLMIATAVLCYCLYTVLSRRITGCSDLSITYVLTAVGSTLFGSWAILRGIHSNSLPETVTLPFVQRDFLASTLYLGILCSIVALFLFNKGLSAIGPNRLSSFIATEPVITIAAGITMLHETILLPQAIGAVITIVGVYLANTSGKAP